MDAARSLVFTNVTIALPASIYVLAIIARAFLIPELKAEKLELVSTSRTRLSVSAFGRPSPRKL